MPAAPAPPKPMPKPKPKPKPKPPRPPEPEPEPDGPITQAELVEYRRLRKRLEVLEEDVSDRRQSLVDRLRRGAAVESGRWIPRLHRQEARHFSAEVVEEAFGVEAMREVLAMIRPAVRWSVSIDPDEGG